MDTRKKTAAFLSYHGFPVHGPEINGVIDALLYDMQASLDTVSGGVQEMIPTWSMPPSNPPKNSSVIVIDAGGTNFRSCLVTFDSSGAPVISDLQKCSMPATERELGKKEFFLQIAKNLEHLKEKANAQKDGIRIGFCFSYAMKITPEGDGEVLSFSKEIKAKEVIGSLVGASLSDTLVECGWKRPKKIILLNDTTAALLSGASNSNGRKFSSYIGIILGTGMNSAYIESNKIKKIENQKNVPHKQIVVCESGLFNKVPRSGFDIEFDKTTNTPNKYVVEKMCSGGYLGPSALVMLKTAAKENLFSTPVSNAILNLAKLELKDMDMFFYTPYKTDTLLGELVSKGTQEDYDTLFLLLDAYVERSARLTAAVISAAVIKSGEGKNPTQPVSVLCEGTTFYKTHNLRQRLEAYVHQALTEQRSLYYEIVSLENAITLGAAVAGLI